MSGARRTAGCCCNRDGGGTNPRPCDFSKLPSTCMISGGASDMCRMGMSAIPVWESFTFNGIATRDARGLYSGQTGFQITVVKDNFGGGYDGRAFPATAYYEGNAVGCGSGSWRIDVGGGWPFGSYGLYASFLNINTRDCTGCGVNRIGGIWDGGSQVIGPGYGRIGGPCCYLDTFPYDPCTVCGAQDWCCEGSGCSPCCQGNNLDNAYMYGR